MADIKVFRARNTTGLAINGTRVTKTKPYGLIQTTQLFKCKDENIIEALGVDVQPVKRGKWSDQMLFDDGFGGGRVGYICSACKKYVPFKGNFCGECGADMREPTE